MNTALKASDLRPGTVLAWDCWGGEAAATVTCVDGHRISTDRPGVYWESSLLGDLDTALRRTHGLRIVAPG